MSLEIFHTHVTGRVQRAFVSGARRMFGHRLNFFVGFSENQSQWGQDELSDVLLDREIDNVLNGWLIFSARAHNVTPRLEERSEMDAFFNRCWVKCCRWCFSVPLSKTVETNECFVSVWFSGRQAGERVSFANHNTSKTASLVSTCAWAITNEILAGPCDWKQSRLFQHDLFHLN